MDYTLNRIETDGFEQEWVEDHGHDVLVVTEPGGPAALRAIGSIFDQPGWLFWMHHVPDVWDQPEARDAWVKNDSRRVRTGAKAAMWFTVWRKHRAGMLRKIAVLPGQHVTFSFYAHCWSNGLSAHLDDPYWSDGAGNVIVDWLEADVLPRGTGNPEHDAMSNLVLRAGIHPRGGQNPLDDVMIWSAGRCIFNGYSARPISVSCIVPAGVTEITVVMESIAHYPFKHNDVYVDSASVTIEDPVSAQPVASGSKLGLHILQNGPGVAECLAARPAVAVFDGEWGLSSSMPAGTLCIGTISHTSFDAQQLYNDGKTPAAAAKYLFDKDCAKYYLPHPRITHWTGCNEAVWTTREQMSWYAQFEIERIKLLATIGKAAVIGEFATGTPEFQQWPEFLPALRYGADHGALLGLHEYSCPWMWWMTGSYQVDPNEDQGDEGWSTLRYRKVKRQILEPNGINIPIVITECGIDPGSNPKPPGAPAATWKGLGDYWREHDGKEDKAAYYVEQLIWYDDELRKDKYVKGAAIFCAGNYGKPWSDFDIAGSPVIEAVTQRVMSVLDPPYIPEEPPEDPPHEPGRGAPRVQYKSRVNVVPADATEEQAIAIFAEGWRRSREMTGGSYDQAGIGDLDERTAALYGIDRDDQQEYIDFYVDYYPGVTVEFAPLPGELSELKLAYPSTHMPPVITSKFNENRGTYIHKGLDLRSSWRVWRDKLICALTGEVITSSDIGSGYGIQVRTETILGDGRQVLIRYAHLVDGDRVAVGDHVAVGDVIGLPDSTGNSTADHLHFDVKIDGEYVDPEPLIDWPAEKPEPPANGAIRGVHGAPVTFPPSDQTFWLQELKAMGIYWYKDMSCDVSWCKRLLDAGIEPVVRLYQGEQFPGRLSNDRFEAARRLIDAGVFYFEIGNEPNLTCEWKSSYKDQVDWHNDDLVRQVAYNWWLDAQKIAAMGGKPSLYAMAPTERSGGCNERYSSVRWLEKYLAALHKITPMTIVDLVESGDVWMAVHVSPFDRPFLYDPYVNGPHPDDMCLRAFEVYGAIAEVALGVLPLMISTEGGLYSPEHLDFLGWTPYSENEWADRMPEMFEFIAEQYPYVLGMCPWILTDLGVADPRWLNNGWYRGVEPRPVALALRRTH